MCRPSASISWLPATGVAGLSGLRGSFSACARPAALCLAPSGLLPVRGMAACRGGARGLQRLWQDHPVARAVGAAGFWLHGRVRGVGPCAVPRVARASSRGALALQRQAALEAHRVLRRPGALESFEGVQIVGIDETSLRRGQSYITVAHDLDTKRLLFATEGETYLFTPLSRAGHAQAAQPG